MQARPNRMIPIRCALVLLASFAVYFCPEDARAVRPFVTDDARIVYTGQLVTETYGGITQACVCYSTSSDNHTEFRKGRPCQEEPS